MQDEAVALGAAVMAARQQAPLPLPGTPSAAQTPPQFDSEELGPQVVDATAHSLGIQHGGRQRLMVTAAFRQAAALPFARGLRMPPGIDERCSGAPARQGLRGHGRLACGQRMRCAAR